MGFVPFFDFLCGFLQGLFRALDGNFSFQTHQATPPVAIAMMSVLSAIESAIAWELSKCGRFTSECFL